MQKYHHGDLPAALRAATATLIAERGPTGFSLREVARRAGVSHAAPAHHFGNATGLLTSVATEGFTILGKAFAAVPSAGDPVRWLLDMGKAYLRVAFDNPGHFGVMCTESLINADDSDYLAASALSFTYLEEAVNAIADKYNPALDRQVATALTWSAVHGLATLVPSFMSETQPDLVKQLVAAEKMLESFATLLMNGYKKR